MRPGQKITPHLEALMFEESYLWTIREWAEVAGTCTAAIRHFFRARNLRGRRPHTRKLSVDAAFHAGRVADLRRRLDERIACGMDLRPLRDGLLPPGTVLEEEPDIHPLMLRLARQPLVAAA